MMNTTTSISKKKEKKKIGLSDYYWAHADILRGIGIPESTYDQRVLAFMALKLLIDNGRLKFNFDYRNQFGLDDADYAKYKGKDTKATFSKIMKHLPELGKNLLFFEQEARFNPGNSTQVLAYINHPRGFLFDYYINELNNDYLEQILDIYVEKADFKKYPKDEYKDLYEKTCSRMRERFTGDMNGQHFTQKSIIHLMCETAIPLMKENETIAIYDPTCGTGSMIMESAFYFHQHKKTKGAKVEVFGQEISGQLWLFSKIFLEISSIDGKTQGIKNTIAYGNTLTQPAFSKGINGKDSFDFIIANPPFGVDWKHDYEKVVKNMISKDPHFMVVQEGRKIITPKKSDGQFLFMMHIINLMEQEKAKGKRAFAAVISSSTLISTGTKTSSEAKIRRQIFKKKIVRAVIEQPNDMFTNTNICSHIWFLDSEEKPYIKIIKANNEEEILFCKHPKAQDKMKKAYSDENIKRLIRIMNVKKEYEFVSKNFNPEDQCEINLSAEIGKRDIIIDRDLDKLEKEIDDTFTELAKILGFNVSKI
ncbi:MAG: HsdM family class I SAM-dependent methyltransferase [Saprospiraceae bacterium]